jgi:hypothetical protein
MFPRPREPEQTMVSKAAAPVGVAGSAATMLPMFKSDEGRARLKLARKRMPGLKAAIAPDADHIAGMAQPDDVNARIIHFLGADSP